MTTASSSRAPAAFVINTAPPAPPRPQRSPEAEGNAGASEFRQMLKKQDQAAQQPPQPPAPPARAATQASPEASADANTAALATGEASLSNADITALLAQQSAASAQASNTAEQQADAIETMASPEAAIDTALLRQLAADTDADTAADTAADLDTKLEQVAAQLPTHSDSDSDETATAALLLSQQQQAQAALAPESLVAQTRRMDTAADTALRDGTAPFAASAGRGAAWGAALGVGAGGPGAGVPTVAIGNQPVSETAALTQALQDSASAAADALGLSPSADGGRGDDATSSGPGRILLDKSWQPVADVNQSLNASANANAAMTRVIGQIEQWAAAGAGVQPGRGPRSAEATSADAPSAAELNALAAAQGAGSSTRLTDTAVQASAQAEQSTATGQQPQPAQDTFTQDMRMWLQGRHQRAELTLQGTDGEPVRVQVALNGRAAHITLSSSAETTRTALDANIAQLRDMLAAQGVELAALNVQDQSNTPSNAAQANAQNNSQNNAGQGQPNPSWQGPGRVVSITTPAPSAAAPRSLSGLDAYA